MDLGSSSSEFSSSAEESGFSNKNKEMKLMWRARIGPTAADAQSVFLVLYSEARDGCFACKANTLTLVLTL